MGSFGVRYCNGAISPPPFFFVLAMQFLLNAVGSNVPEAHLVKGLYMPSLKAFMDHPSDE